MFTIFILSDDKNVIYMTIHQKNFDGAINSSAVELQSSNTQKMVDYVFGLFNHFINSNSTIRLDESFKVYFLVLSMENVNSTNHKRKKAIVVGALDGNAVRNQGTIEVCAGYPKNPIAFVNKCLLTSVLLGFFLNESQKTENKIFESLLYLCEKVQMLPRWIRIKNPKKKFTSPQDGMKNKAGLLLENELKKLIESCEIEPCGPYDIYTILPKLSEYFKSQIHVIQNLQGENASMISVPDQFDCSLPQIFLDATIPDHVCMISNTVAYCRQFNKSPCMFCKKTGTLYRIHDCATRKICKKCRRYYSDEKTIDHTAHFLKFCDSKIRTDFDDGSKPRCDVCNQEFNTANCMEAHESQCGIKKPNKPLPKGRNGFYCESCQRGFRYGFANAEDAKKNHICDKSLVKCKLCYKLEDESHCCRIKQQSFTTKWPNLAFFSFTYRDLEECHKCFQHREKFRKENNLSLVELYKHEKFSTLYCSEVCGNEVSYAEPNVAIIFKEIERGVFKKFVLCDDELELNTIEKDETKKIDYCSEPAKQKLVICQSYLKNVTGMKKSLESILKKDKKSVVEKFILLITQADWQNYTFLSFNGDRCENLSILRAFSEINLLPSVIQNGSRIISMFFKFLQIRFINASAFITGSLDTWIEQNNLLINQHYFPSKLNKKSYYNYSGSLPGPIFIELFFFAS